MTVPLPATASVVIIGGGIVGVASAYALAAAGVEDVVVVERDQLGSGSTCKAAGGLRTQFSDETNIMLGARSLETFRRFETDFGTDLDLVTSGYLFLIDNEEDASAFERNVALQQSLGQSSRMLTVSQAHELCPVIDTSGLVAAAFNPDDAHCTPEAAVSGFACAARRLGVTFVQDCTVTDIVTSGTEIHGVRTTKGEITASRVVCAAGAWSQAIGLMAGVELPVTPLRRHVAVTEPVDFDAARLPFTIDFGTSFYFHSECRGLLMGAPEVEDVRAFNLHTDPAWLDRLAELIEHRAPGLGDVGIGKGWAGLYECTPDHNALIGTAAALPGFVYATGFSGHGFLQGPAVGEVVRDLCLGRTPFVDVSGLSVERFDRAELRVEMNVV